MSRKPGPFRDGYVHGTREVRMKCPVCDDDGWYASPSWADEEKKSIRIIKVPCPRGCPQKQENSDESPIHCELPRGG